MTALDAAGIAADPISNFRPVSAPRAHDERLRTTVAPRVQPALERRRLWERRYATRLRVTDTLIAIAAAGAVFVADLLTAPRDVVGHALVAAIVSVVWIAMLGLGHTRAASIMGSGPTEYKRVAHATGYAFGILAMVFIFTQWEPIRLQLMFALPAGMLVLLVARWSWRRWLHRERQFGHYASRAIVTGSRDDIEYVIRTLEQGGQLGHVVVGTTTTDGDDHPIVVDGRIHPVVGSVHSTAAHARELGADSIIVASRPDDDPDFIKRLSWELEGTASELILSSRLADVAGPRISLRPIDGLPLIHVQIPEFEGGKHSIKRAMDIVVAALALIPITIIGLPIAAAIWLEDRGPIFFRQTRIGRDGTEFRMIKFRSMRVDAEARLAELQAQNEGSGVLFKMKKDPRVTRVGAILRKFSLDELPQFLNVLLGDMSVVGPRPPLPVEVSKYESTVYRRLYIKPGITGLWQISGRSDLSWDESVRLDLRYVENWSIMNDLMIMWRTAKVMVSPKGAY